MTAPPTIQKGSFNVTANGSRLSARLTRGRRRHGIAGSTQRRVMSSPSSIRMISGYPTSSNGRLDSSLEARTRRFVASATHGTCNSAGRSKTSFELAGLNKSPAYGLFVNPFPVIATRFLLFNQVVAVRRQTLQEVGGFNNELWLMEDYELALRLSVLGPWGVVREPLVIKDNTTEGIGVKAMRTQEKQLPILVNMIRHFLSEDHSCLDRDLHVLRRRLRTLEKALFASHLARSGTRHDAFVGKLRLAFLRCWRRAERKLPTWPKPKFAEFPERKQPAATEAQPIELR